LADAGEAAGLVELLIPKLIADNPGTSEADGRGSP
jgi:hypothetical protein